MKFVERLSEENVRSIKNAIHDYLKPNCFPQISEDDSSSLQSSSTDYMEDDTQNRVELEMLTIACDM